VPIHKELGFGFTWLTGDKNSEDYPDLRFEDYPFAKVDMAKLKTVNDCLELWPPSWAFMGSVHQTLLEKAIDLVTLCGTSVIPINALVGSHTPTIEMPAALLDRSFPRLNEGDLVVYEVEVFSGGDEVGRNTEARLVRAHYYPCPS
jgi:hypothetical protein